MGPTWGPSGSDRTQVGPMLAPWTLLSGLLSLTGPLPNKLDSIQFSYRTTVNWGKWIGLRNINHTPYITDHIYGVFENYEENTVLLRDLVLSQITTTRHIQCEFSWKWDCCTWRKLFGNSTIAWCRKRLLPKEKKLLQTWFISWLVQTVQLQGNTIHWPFFNYNELIMALILRSSPFFWFIVRLLFYIRRLLTVHGVLSLVLSEMLHSEHCRSSNLTLPYKSYVSQELYIQIYTMIIYTHVFNSVLNVITYSTRRQRKILFRICLLLLGKNMSDM